HLLVLLRNRCLGHLVGLRPSVTAVSARVDLAGPPQVTAVEVGPKSVQKDELGISRLPQQEVGQPLFTGGAYEQVDRWYLRGVEMPGKGVLGDLLRGQIPRDGPARHLTNGIDDLRLTSVVHAELQSHPGVVPCHLLRVTEFGKDALPQHSAAPGPTHTYTACMKFVTAIADRLPVETEQETDLVGRTLPVLRGKGVGGQMRDAHFQGALDHVEERGLPRL